jgi:hypothetical protein
VNVRSELFLTSAAVYINDVPHLIFRREQFLALQSWTDEACHRIELTFASGPVVTMTYERRETWLAVLLELAKMDLTAV